MKIKLNKKNVSRYNKSSRTFQRHVPHHKKLRARQKTQNRRKIMNTEKEKNEEDTWENRISQFAKVTGRPVADIENFLADKPLELTESSPNALEMLSDDEITPFGDLRFALVDKGGISLPLFRAGIKFLRGDKETRKQMEVDPDLMALHKKYGIDITINALPLETLLEFYDPSKNNEIAEILKNKYESKYGKFIAFKPETKDLAIDEILDYIADLDTGFDKVEHIDIDGEPCRLYSINEVPNEKLNEDPLYIGFPLRKERSTKNRISWEGVELPERQFFRILANMGLIDREDRISIGQIIDKPVSSLKEIFPEAYVRYVELKEDDELPKLKINSRAINRRIQDPFKIR